MILRAVAFTDRGAVWADRLGVAVERPARVMKWTAEVFETSDAILFIGAAGIAVRAVAPHIRKKTTDPAVLVMDELGRHVIPLLSGHIGGANELAHWVAARTGAEPVITTATDINNVPAVDTWAVKNDLAIENPAAIAPVSAAALAGRPVGVMITERALKPPFPVTLVLRPRTLVLGAGSKRGVDAAYFETSCLAFLEKCGVSLLAVRAVASIDLKANEPALVSFSEKYHLPLLTYPTEKLRSVPGTFAHSDYVEKTVGVGCVCERAACAAGGCLLMGKTIYDGMTLALAGEENT